MERHIISAEMVHEPNIKTATTANYDPRGETFVLEHSYTLRTRLGSNSFYSTWEALQKPFDRLVHVRLYQPFEELGLGERAIKRLKGVVERGGEGGLAIDFGEVPSGAPFLVLNPPPGWPLLEWWDKTGTSEDLARLALAMIESLEDARDSQRVELTLERVRVIEEDQSLRAVLYCIGDSPTRSEIREMTGLTQRDMVLAFPPECFVPRADNPEFAERTEAADVYRVAAILYQLVHAKHPVFPGNQDVSDSVAALINELLRANPEPRTGDDELDLLLRKALKLDPAQRPTLDQLVLGFRSILSPSITQDQASVPLEPPSKKPVRLRTTDLSGLFKSILFIIFLLLAVVGTYLWSNRPPSHTSLLITTEPTGVWLQTPADEGEPRTLGRTPLVVEQLGIGQPIRLQPIYEDHSLGEVFTVSPDQLESLEDCRTLQITFRPSTRAIE